jgi:hypothetical protein
VVSFETFQISMEDTRPARGTLSRKNELLFPFYQLLFISIKQRESNDIWFNQSSVVTGNTEKSTLEFHIRAEDSGHNL